MNRSMARSTIYNNLSLCFTYPDEKICAWILEKQWIEVLEEALSLLTEEDFEKHFQSFKDSLWGERETLALELAREYTRLFINAFPHVVAPPYGSVYMEKDGLVFGKVTSEVLRFYHETGFTLKEDLHDLPDHIAHELEFMGILTAREAQASGADKVKLEETQMNFLSRFILPWIPSFCQRIGEQNHSSFYRTLGDLTREFMNMEKNYLGVPEEMNSQKSIEAEIRGG